MEEDKTKIVGDMYLAAALLSYGVDLIGINKSNPKRQTFEFSPYIKYIFFLDGNNVPITILNPKIDDVEAMFISRKLLLPPTYPDSLRTVKASIHI